jgi:hypothetical protein
MKRTTLGILGLFIAVFTLLTSLSSCEKEHFYKAEVTILDQAGLPVQGVVVTTNIDVNQPHIVGRTDTTGANGKVQFDFYNVANMKVEADKGNLHGEGRLILEEDITVKVNVIVYP